MTLQSMTGFARAHGHADCGAASGNWVWELRSVNSKGLEIRFRLPPGFEPLENEYRKLLGAKLARGSVQAALQYERQSGASVPTINHAALDAVLAAIVQIGKKLGSPPPAAEAILQIRGVMETGEDTAAPQEIELRNAAVIAGLAGTVEALVHSRASEGRAVAAVLGGQIGSISSLVAAIDADASRSPSAIRQRLKIQLATLLEDATAFDPQRLHQEAAILATKSDLREEIDRLHAHVAASGVLLAGKGPAGRKLDFLAQEFNRECNTICSKSNAASVTSFGLEMKAVIDQFREQVQNIE